MEGFFDDILDTIRKNGRVEEMSQIARNNGFTFKNRERFAVQNFLLKSFSIFSGKNDKRFKGILKKVDASLNAEIRIYDYFYFGDFKKRKTTVYEVSSKDLDLPKFEIRPKGILNQVTSFFWDKDKPYPEEKDFHAKFEILAKDADNFEAEISPKILDFIFDKKNISVEGDGKYLLVYYTYQQTPATEINETSHFVLDLVELIMNDDSNEYV